MKLKDVNTTDLYVTDRNKLARVVMTGQLWKSDSFDRSDFPFCHVVGRNTQGRVGNGYTGYTIGHLVVVYWDIITLEAQRELTELELPAFDSDTSYDEQRATLKAFLERLKGTNFRLTVANTQRMKLLDDQQREEQQQREKQERQHNERRDRQDAVIEQFNRLAPAFSLYTQGVGYHRTQVSYQSYAGSTPSVKLTLDELERLLADARLGREQRG